MSHAIMTIQGLFDIDNTLFYGFDGLPDGIDKDVLIDKILMDAGDFSLIYPNPITMKHSISMWINRYNRTFTKWIEALNIEYNPLENYDRKEDWTDEGESNSSSNSTNTGNASSTNLNKVSAYDSPTLQNDTESSVTSSNKDTSANTYSDENASTHSGRIHGNIGVTTSQQMLQAELDIAMWNVYQHITDLFIQEFCIPVY